MSLNVPTARTPVLKPTVNVALVVLQYLLVAMFLSTSIPKFLGTQSDVASYADIGMGQWLRYATASFELLGAIGLLVPRLVGLAAAGLTALLLGAVLTQAFLVTDGSVVLPVILLVLCATVAWFRRDRITALISSRGTVPDRGVSAR
jgi:putative oxidoreductase